MSDTLQRIGQGYAQLLAGIVRDFGVSRDDAASIVARAGHWQTTCDCGTRYGPDGNCSTCSPPEADAAPPEADAAPPRLTRRQAAIIGAYTGYTCGPFGDVHGYVDSLPGFKGIGTIGFALPGVADKIRDAARADFLALCFEEPAERRAPEPQGEESHS